MEKVVFDPETLRFTQGNRVHQDVTKCMSCGEMAMKLVNETDKERTFRCTKCGAVMTEDK